MKATFLQTLIKQHIELTLEENPEDYLSLDTETTGLELSHDCKPFFLSTCGCKGSTKFWEWSVDPLTRIPSIPSDDLLEIADYISNKIIIFHHASFDIRACETIGLKIIFERDEFKSQPKRTIALARCNTFHDTQLASHPIRTSDPRGLKDLALLHLDYSDKDERDLKDEVQRAARYAKKHHPDWKLGYDLKGTRQTAYDYWLPKAIDPKSKSNETYGCNDAERTMLLWLLYLEQFRQKDFQPSLKCYTREKLLLPTFYRKGSRGVTLKQRSINRVCKDLVEKSKKHKAVTTQIGRQVTKRKDFNPDSTKDNRLLLFNKRCFNLPIGKASDKTGDPSTDKATLEDLLERSSKPRTIKYLRNLLMTRTHQSSLTYLEAYRRFMLPTQYKGIYRLLTSIHQVGTATTRIASYSPNQQNVAVRDVIEVAGKEIQVTSLRSLFSPAPGKVWYTIDYSQLELHIYAVIAKDKELVAAFQRGEDIHNFIATKMFPGRKITKELRVVAKKVAFGIIYGKAPKNIDLAAGFKGAYDLFVSKFKSLPIIKRELIKQAKEYGYVETLFGYQLDIPFNRMSTTVIDYVCQGTAGDTIKNAEIAIDRKGLVDWKHSSILLQVHDELVFEVDDGPQYNNAKWLQAIIDEMERAGEELGVYTPVETKIIRDHWGNGQVVKIKNNQIVLAA